jgi:hypothetical protein
MSPKVGRIRFSTFLRVPYSEVGCWSFQAGIFVASDVLSLAFGTGVVASAGRNRPLRVAGGLLVGVGVANMISPFTPMHTREVLAAGGGTGTDKAHLTVLSATTLQPGFTDRVLRDVVVEA